MSPDLPDWCYVNNVGEAVIARRGEMGFYPLTPPIPAARIGELNAALGVTNEQAEAMQTGSMFGWDVPGADPAYWTGKLRKLN